MSYIFLASLVGFAILAGWRERVLTHRINRFTSLREGAADIHGAPCFEEMEAALAVMIARAVSKLFQLESAEDFKAMKLQAKYPVAVAVYLLAAPLAWFYNLNLWTTLKVAGAMLAVEDLAAERDKYLSPAVLAATGAKELAQVTGVEAEFFVLLGMLHTASLDSFDGLPRDEKERRAWSAMLASGYSKTYAASVLPQLRELAEAQLGHTYWKSQTVLMAAGLACSPRGRLLLEHALRGPQGR